MKAFIDDLPKVELHCHLEGTLEPEHLLELAARHGVDVGYRTVAEVLEAYQFQNLDSFLKLYYQGCDVLRTEQDFYDLTYRYLRRSKADNLVHTEVFCDPQSHTHRGISFDAVLDGITRALVDGERDFGITSHIIICFLRHLTAESAMSTLEQTLAYRDKYCDEHRIIGVGLDSSELGNEPAKFAQVFARAHEAGFLCCCHAGEEGPPSYVWSAINDLKIHRIDHGVRCLEDDDLVRHLKECQMALTVCPFSNLKLAVVDDLRNHPLRRMLDAGLAASIHSDDPAYFGGYVNENYRVTGDALQLDAGHMVQLARNAIDGSFLNDDAKQALYLMLKECCDKHSVAINL